MGVMAAISLIIIAIVLFIAGWKEWIPDKAIRLGTNVASIVAVLAAIAIFVIPAATPPTTPTPTSTPPLANTATSVPMPTNTPRPISSSTPQSIDTTVRLGKTLFEEDFEDGKAQLLEVYDGNWDVVQEDNTNSVLEIDNINSSKYPGFNYGSLEWDDYVGEYRVKMLEFQEGAVNQNIVFSFRSNHIDEDYVQAFKLLDNKLVAAYSLFPNPGWLVLKETSFQIEPGLWYSVSVEVIGEHAQIFVDELLVAEFTDSRLQTGGLGQQVGPGVHAQFDDIRVISLEE